MKESKTDSGMLHNFYESLNQSYRTGDVQGIEKFLMDYEECLLESKRNRGMLVTVYNEQGSFYRQTGRYHHSIEAFRKAQDEIVFSLGTTCTEYAALVNNMAGTYRLAGRHDEAIRLFQDAVRIYREAGEGGSYACANVHKNLSLAYQETGKTDPAVSHLRLALDLVKDTKDHKQESVVIYSNLTALYHKAGSTLKAIQCMNQALLSFETYCDIKNAYYGAALNSLGGFLCGLGEYSRAIEVYKKAADYTLTCFGPNADCISSYQNMYWAYMHIGERNSAVQALTASAEVCLNLFGPEHEHTITIQNELMRITGREYSEY